VTWSGKFATLFGIGRFPVMPGTAASFVAAILAWPLTAMFGPIALLVFSIAVGLLAIPVSGAYARQSGREDPPDCVIDELAGQWLACAIAPLTLPGFALAFALFRLFDMTKLWPVSAAEKLKGGLGIVADDMAAGLIAGLVVLVLARYGVV
jgi:phosphatidylglycerophosphatase A